MLAREPRGAADVIVMLVRDHDRAELFGLKAESSEAPRGIGETESAIEQHTRAARFHDQGVALAAAAE
jgi:hypothetical protein